MKSQMKGMGEPNSVNQLWILWKEMIVTAFRCNWGGYAFT
jgi:hypothetical protein